jgi:hypothetical protein
MAFSGAHFLRLVVNCHLQARPISEVGQTHHMNALSLCASLSGSVPSAASAIRRLPPTVWVTASVPEAMTRATASPRRPGPWRS